MGSLHIFADNWPLEGEGVHSTMHGILVSHPAAPGSLIPGNAKNFFWWDIHALFEPGL